jgi:nicotinamidase-related amidase
MSALTIDPATTALVLIDLQRGIVNTPTAPHAASDVIGRAALLARRFRERRALVVLVHVDAGANGELFPSPLADTPRPAHHFTPDWSTIVSELGPEPGDAIVTKHQPNAFYATDLDVHLRARGIRTIVLAGISTNVGVEATARAAHERRYDQIFIEDAMTARDAEAHAGTIRHTFPTMGRVRSAEEVLHALA